MKHVFIINPKAGKTSKALDFAEKVKEYFADHEGEYVIRETEYEGHATKIADEECSNGEYVRIYACGGDGTLMEAACGVYGHDNAEITVVPCGSGNDYIRTYGTADDFADVNGIIQGSAIPVDAIKCGKDISLNICAMGMDADVANKMVRFKHLPFVSGSMAYTLAIANVFFHRFGRDLRIEINTPDGVVEREGRYMFVVMANGRYYGGGYCAAPMAETDDKLMDFVLIKLMGRIEVLKFLGKYKEGKYMDNPKCEIFRGTNIRILSKTPAVCTVDGQCFSDTEIRCDLLENAFKFVLPANLYAKYEKVKQKVEV